MKIQGFDPTTFDSYTKIKVYEEWAEILDDTTIYFFKNINHKDKDEKLNDTFHFRYCENKPDSTNILMDW